MKNILILGAGRSSSSLIQYLIKACSKNGWFLRIADITTESLKERFGDYSFLSFVDFDVSDNEQRNQEVQTADVVISMLPAIFHGQVAEACLEFDKHLFTASYISDSIKNLSEQIKKKGLLFFMECGLDPGLDHMTAMQAIDRIKEKGGIIESFKSFAGGLVAPESDNNPWNYKFTWNPRNVVLAGQGTARYIKNGQYKYIPYHKLFTRIDNVHIKGFGDFEAYANRDSLSYRTVYGLEDIPTILRGTLRRPGFCKSWNLFVQLGMTDDSYFLENSEKLSARDYVNTFLPFHPDLSVEDKLCQYLNIQRNSKEFYNLEWLGIFESRPVGKKGASPAMILQKILEDKWKLDASDKDMVAMQHQFEYHIDGKRQTFTSSLVALGDDSINTAMAKTVGLPLGIVVRLFMEGKFKRSGLVLPVTRDIYAPVISELESTGVHFIEEYTDDGPS